MKYILLLATLLYGQVSCFQHDGIIISIEPGRTEANTTIKYEGDDKKLLTDLDINAFNLTKDNLEKAVKLYSGKEATDIFINSPTPWNLYETYNWSEVKREFRIKDIKLINVTEKEIDLGSKTYTNNDTTIKDINGSVVVAYETFRSRHYWSGDNVAAKIKYELLHHGAYLSKVGEDDFGSGLTSITYGGRTARFTLQPQQTAKLYLIALEVTTRIMIEYETELTGDIVVNYAKKHEGHHFWAYDVNKVISAANMTTAVKSNEYVEVIYLPEEGYETEVVDAKSAVDIEFTRF